MFPREVGGLATIALAAAERAGARSRGRRSRAGRLDRLPRARQARSAPSRSPTLYGALRAAGFRGRIVVVGASAPTLRDVHATPVGDGEPMAGAEVQANAIWTALHGAPLRGAPPALPLLLVALLALVAPLLGIRFPALVAGLAGAARGGAVRWWAPSSRSTPAWSSTVVAPLAALVVGAVARSLGASSPRAARAATVTRDNELLEARVRERTRSCGRRRSRSCSGWAWRSMARRGDRPPHRADRPVLRAARAGGRHESGGRRAPAPRQRPARCRQGRHPRRDPRKPGPLDGDEWATMQTHTTIGGEHPRPARHPCSSSSPSRSRSPTTSTGTAAAIRSACAGSEIPLAGRICAICDVFDALLSSRPYKDPWPIDRDDRRDRAPVRDAVRSWPGAGVPADRPRAARASGSRLGDGRARGPARAQRAASRA